MPEDIMNNTVEEFVENGIGSGLDWKTVAIVGVGAFALGVAADALVKPKITGLLNSPDDEDEEPKRRRPRKGETVIDVEAEEVNDEE